LKEVKTIDLTNSKYEIKFKNMIHKAQKIQDEIEEKNPELLLKIKKSKKTNLCTYWFWWM